ncbi:hypothetical protein BU26DRAFT_609882 [Trematosphaeria pertusa]|uniref:Uncharacterized protein n=1 Tax=Trematosphaeria pertusa TaxID=390896 RepID=A0A6A6HYW9_9PLEO|nr:uncharacterized protein BU26DRAFT_609882 [Trematosphaeria pertusa]KAF2242540.1 hypothetical protein BU26DRAFT_609882 [Trematosphaeria pertusa]
MSLTPSGSVTPKLMGRSNHAQQYETDSGNDASSTNTTLTVRCDHESICLSKDLTKLHDDPNAISDPIQCNDGDSNVGYQDSKSITISFTISPGKLASEWIPGGFSVSESWTTGNSYSAMANKVRLFATGMK